MADQSEKKEERAPMRSWQPINPFETMRDMMNRMMDTFIEPLTRVAAPSGMRVRAQPFRPNVDVIEEDEDIRVIVEVPGMSPDDLAVMVTQDSVVIRGEKKQEQIEGKGVHRAERTYGAFRRVIPLPGDVDKDNVQATFKNGILTVILQKSKEAVKKVPIRIEEG